MKFKVINTTNNTNIIQMLSDDFIKFIKYHNLSIFIDTCDGSEYTIYETKFIYKW